MSCHYKHQLMNAVWEMSNVCSENRMTCIDALCGKDAKFPTGTKYQQLGLKVCLCACVHTWKVVGGWYLIHVLSTGLKADHAASLRQSTIKSSFSWKDFGFHMQIIRPSPFSDYAMSYIMLTQPLPISRLRVKILSHKKKIMKLLLLALKFLLFQFFFKILSEI